MSSYHYTGGFLPPTTGGLIPDDSNPSFSPIALGIIIALGIMLFVTLLILIITLCCCYVMRNKHTKKKTVNTGTET